MDDRAMKKKVSITLDDDTIETIKSYADNDERSFSQYINLVLNAHIRRMENRKSKK